MKKHCLIFCILLVALSVQAQHQVVSFFDEFGQHSYPTYELVVDDDSIYFIGDTIRCYYQYTYDHKKQTAEAVFIGINTPDTIVVPDTIVYDSKPYIVTGFKNGINPGGNVWFYGNYTTLILPRTLKEFRVETMQENKRLVSIDVPEDNPYFTTIDGVLYNKNVTRLILCPQSKAGTLYLPKTVKEINDLAFYNCHELKRIVVEEGNSVFHTEDGLLMQGNTLIAYPAKKDYNYCFIKPNVTSIAKHAIPLDYKSWIAVEKDNKQYTDIAGVMYSKNGKTLIAYPGGRTAEDFSIPEGTTSITSTAFYGCPYLRELTLPHSIKKIESGAFDNLKNLRFLFNYACVPQIKGDGIYIPGRMFIPEDMIKKYKKSIKWKDEYFLPMTVSGGKTFKWYISAPQKTLWYTGEYKYSQFDSYYYDDLIERIIVGSFGRTSTEFKDFTNVKEFLVMDDSRHSYISDDGVLISIWSHEDTALVAYPRVREGQDYTIPEYVSVIEQDAFYKCHLSTLYIPSKLRRIDPDWTTYGYFSEGYFSQFVVSPENQWYYSKDGVLFEKEKENMPGRVKLMAYPEGKQDSCYIVPHEVTDITFRAFHDNQYLQEIHIPEGIQWMAGTAFNNCKNLQTIYMYSSRPPMFDTSVKSSWNYCEGFGYATKIYVPEDAVETYKNNYEWEVYADIIFPMPKQDK